MCKQALSSDENDGDDENEEAFSDSNILST